MGLSKSHIISLRQFIYISDYVLCCKVHEMSYCTEQKAVYLSWHKITMRPLCSEVKTFFKVRLAIVSRYLLVATLPTS